MKTLCWYVIVGEHKERPDLLHMTLRVYAYSKVQANNLFTVYHPEYRILRTRKSRKQT